MGCFQSKQKKYQKQKAKSIKIPKIHEGQFNLRWKRLLENSQVKKFVITDTKDVPNHPAFVAIDKDVNRTFQNHKFFNYRHNVDLFSQTLKCFALTFPKVGYTQGLNFLTGYLLINELNKGQTLVMLANICTHPSLMSLGLYQDGFPLAHFYCSLFWKILEKLDSQLYDCLKLIQIPDYMWIFQWYLTFFIYSIPLQYIGPFFNFIFEYKDFAMVKLSIGIVLCLRQKILDLPEKDQISFAQFLQSLKQIKTCIKYLQIQPLIKQSYQIPNSLIQQSLKQLSPPKSQQSNFYQKYFSTPSEQRKSFHKNFINQLQDRKVQLQNSKHNNTSKKLYQSYKRDRQTVQIIDEILLQSIKRHKQKQYKSTIFTLAHSLTGYNDKFRKWKSLAPVEEDLKNQNQTTVSNVRKYVIPEDK